MSSVKENRKKTFKELKKRCTGRSCKSIYHNGEGVNVIFSKEFLDNPHCGSGVTHRTICTNCERGFQAIRESPSFEKRIKSRDHY